VDYSPPPAPVAAEAALLAVEMVYLGMYPDATAAARVLGLELSSAAPMGTHGQHRWWRLKQY